ncbi:CRISPR-associated endonuclease Cas2 [Alkaliphilus pronyensis]|uniref:CRISPR-associated endoribonuclease Cas2 n=1 Tax=Alkaliphilus pronyensis TaxID=1482732 RepID=A0A6I0F499_9FIRM|nr:CRISPR-associated endonuclease Cas2 [Alkaliphilus pronyensis]KAB3529675.1 CRISPR-associated endonuclease Cas2 [Alkaliphilus pronyensis]
MMVVVSYDVATSSLGGARRLRKVAKQCVNYGQRVQNSVFECVVDPKQFEQLKHSLLSIVDLEKDSIRFYFLGSSWKNRVEHHGIKQIVDVENPIIL